MDKHCCEPITRVESGWRIDYNPCRHYNTLYITIDTKELLFNGVAYNRFNIQDINYQNGTIYINVGNRLLSCKIPNASRECSGLMSPLDKQQLDYIFQLLENGIDSINFSNTSSWGIWIDLNNDRQIQVFVDPVKTLDELENLPEGVEKLISALLLKNLIEINNLKYHPDEEPVILTYTVRLFINNNLVDTATVNSGANYSYTYNELPDGYELIGTGVTINKKNITKLNITGNTDINLSTQLIQYTITENGYDSTIWTRTGYPTNGKYTVINTPLTLTYTLNNPSQYSTSNVTISGRTDLSVNKNGNTYTILLPLGTIENVTIELVASEVETPIINLNPSTLQVITDSIAITATVTNGNSNQVTWSIDNEDTTGETFRLNQKTGSSVTLYANDTSAPEGTPGIIDEVVAYGTTINEDPRIRASFKGSSVVAKKEYSTVVTASYTNATPKSVEVIFRKTTNPLGVGTYTWSIVNGKTLPDGITLEYSSSTGEINDYLVFINNTDSDITIEAGTIQVSNEHASNNPVIYNQDIVVPTKTPLVEKDAWFIGLNNEHLTSTNLNVEQGDTLTSLSWSSGNIYPKIAFSGDNMSLTKGYTNAHYGYKPNSVSIYLDNISNPSITGGSGTLSISNPVNNIVTVLIDPNVTNGSIVNRAIDIVIKDGEETIKTLRLTLNKDLEHSSVNASFELSLDGGNTWERINLQGVNFPAPQVQTLTLVSIRASYTKNNITKVSEVGATYTVKPAEPVQTYNWYVGTTTPSKTSWSLSDLTETSTSPITSFTAPNSNGMFTIWIVPTSEWGTVSSMKVGGETRNPWQTPVPWVTSVPSGYTAYYSQYSGDTAVTDIIWTK